MRDFQASKTAIERDDGLNEIGKRRGLEALAQKTRERLNRHQTILQGYDHLVAQKRSKAAKTRPALSELAEVLAELRRQEVRSLLPQDDALLRVEYERRLADTSGASDLWLEAVETAPLPLLPGEVLDRGRQSRQWRSLSPEARRELEELQSCREALQSVYASARREVGEGAGDPIAELARGQEG